MHTTANPPNFRKILYSPGTSYTLFLDKVLTVLEFTPDSGHAPDSLHNVGKFKDYVRGRYLDDFGIETDESDWSVQVSTPAPAPLTAPNSKIADGLYRVAQADRATGDTPLAWVNVFDTARQELWLFWRPGQVDGFHHVGTTPAGEEIEYEATQLQLTGMPPDGGLTGTLATRVARLKEIARDDADSPVYDITQLDLHHFRVGAT
jgi:hypothetical protein